MMRRCDYSNMRTTINIDAKLHAIVRSIAANNQQSLSDTIEALVKRGLYAETSAEKKGIVERDPDTGLPLIRSNRPITSDDIRSLDDEQ